MLNTLKHSLGVLIGVALGCLVAVALAWYGARMAVDSQMRDVWTRVSNVQNRQQAMADEALQLQPLLQHFGVRAGTDVFRDVENERSLLVGDASLTGKLNHEQRLEEALLRSEQVWIQAGKREARLGAWPDYREYGRIWEKQKRQLVVEEQGLDDAVDTFDGLLVRWPFAPLLAHKTLSGLGGGLAAGVTGDAIFVVRVGLDWMGYGLRRMAALVGQQAPPSPPSWAALAAKRVDAVDDGPYALGLTSPIFLADAPLPEGDYQEIQYTHEVPANYANVELGQDKPVLENRNAPAPYAAPQPHPQMTVGYSAPN